MAHQLYRIIITPFVHHGMLPTKVVIKLKKKNNNWFNIKYKSDYVMAFLIHNLSYQISFQHLLKFLCKCFLFLCILKSYLYLCNIILIFCPVFWFHIIILKLFYWYRPKWTDLFLSICVLLISIASISEKKIVERYFGSTTNKLVLPLVVRGLISHIFSHFS